MLSSSWIKKRKTITKLCPPSKCSCAMLKSRQVSNSIFLVSHWNKSIQKGSSRLRRIWIILSSLGWWWNQKKLEKWANAIGEPKVKRYKSSSTTSQHGSGSWLRRRWGIFRAKRQQIARGWGRCFILHVSCTISSIWTKQKISASRKWRLLTSNARKHLVNTKRS